MKARTPITVLLYDNNLPELEDFRCVHCSRKLCCIDSSVKTLVFDDGYDPGKRKELAPGMRTLEIKCRGCDCIYKFIYQK